MKSLTTPSITPYVLLCLSNRPTWHMPKEIYDSVEGLRENKQLKNPTEAGIRKVLFKLQREGIIKRQVIKPKNKSKNIRKSKWKIKNTDKAFKGIFKLLWEEGSWKHEYVREFIQSKYYKKNQKLIYYLLNDTFHIGQKLTTNKPIYTKNEQKLIDLALLSPSFMSLFIYRTKTNSLEQWFRKEISQNALDYMRFVATACLTVDSYYIQEDVSPYIEETLRYLVPSLTSLRYIKQRKQAQLLQSPDYAERKNKLNEVEQVQPIKTNLEKNKKEVKKEALRQLGVKRITLK
ncbi:hypothetical protein HYV81_04745 [Candidatus Woesearchaeota archaeon]|nr:hypothetical protein [Candidatus Woesearchaeota archaeon]